MTKILAINGSYRDDGITDQAVETMTHTLESAGADVEIVLLREYPIEFCLNCRECTQAPGVNPGLCVQHDGMQALVNKIEQADAYILASPTNFGSVTAIFKRFMERLVVYAYWSWDMNAPRYRKADMPRKKAILVWSCAAPAVMGRWLYSTHKQLAMTAKTIGADTVGAVYTGLIAKHAHPELPNHVRTKIKSYSEKLL
jgi:multimeric flavodoxin WrbA